MKSKLSWVLTIFCATAWAGNIPGGGRLMAAAPKAFATHRWPRSTVRMRESCRSAWSYDTGDAFAGSEMQCNPIVIGGVLYATTPKLRVIALDAANGKLRWSFDPHQGRPVKSRFRTRGLVYAQGRIYVVSRNWLWALEARTGKLATAFGHDGRIDLREGLGRDRANSRYPRTRRASFTATC